MRILIALAEPYLPQQRGGSQTSALEMAAALTRRGNVVAIASTLKRKSRYGLAATVAHTIKRERFFKDVFASAVVYRVPDIHQHVGAAIQDFKSDVVLVQAMAAMPLAHKINAMGVPLAIYWHDVERHRMNGSPEGLRAQYIANSNFTSSFYHTTFGVESTVVPPLIQRELYIALERSPRSIVFVGPVPEKGVDVALGVAEACPNLPFEIVESWLLSRSRRKALMERLASLPNITFVPHQSSMAPIYGRARLLLAPSQWHEAWGRVASEAQINGIPVIGSDIGGLPEAIGPGGVLVRPDAPVQAWAETVRSVWCDEQRYADLSAAARRYSERQELDPDWAAARIEQVLARAIEMTRQRGNMHRVVAG